MKLGFSPLRLLPLRRIATRLPQVATLCAQRASGDVVHPHLARRKAGRHAVELFGRRGFTNVRAIRAWLKQLAATLPQRGLDGVIGFNKLPGLDVIRLRRSLLCRQDGAVEIEMYRWLPRFRHFSELERSGVCGGLSTQILLLTPHEFRSTKKHYRMNEPLPCAASWNRAPRYSEEKRIETRRARAAEQLRR